MTNKVIDVRTIVPRERHPLIFERLAQLSPGEALRLMNDHDPKPLYYQMEAESKEPFKWEYLEKGPADWKVRVIKIKS